MRALVQSSLLALVAPALAVVGPVLALAAPAPRVVDYLYVEANEGGSSGGHVALRLGDETFHFQHEPSGLLRLRRDDSEDFRYRYGVLGNRAMHASRVALPESSYAELRWRFNERYLREHAIIARRDALRDDRELLDLLVARRRGEPHADLRLRGAGFFFPADASVLPSPDVRALDARIATTYGPAFLTRRAAELRQAIATLAPSTTPRPDDVPPADGYPRFATTFAERWRDLLSELVAIDVLASARGLRDEAPSAAAGPALEHLERAALARTADATEDALLRLLVSDRPDRGFALLVGIARLEALRASVRTGRLVVLDAFPPDVEVVRTPRRGHADALRGMLGEAQADVAHARTALHDDGPMSEAALTALEAAASRAGELERAVDGGDLRVATGPMLPSREAAWSEWVEPAVDDADLVRARDVAAAVERRYEAALHERYGYDLVGRNCVSELLATVAGAGVEIGDRPDVPWPLDVVPFVSARAVDERWHVIERTTEPSFRTARLEELYRREPRLLAWLRETNVLTSTIYRRNDEDSFFVLFTDDAVATRPLFGAVNVVAGLGAGAVGLALVPFDGGRTLAAGVRGVVFSLPELAFVSLRKGSFDWVPPAERGAAASGIAASRRP